MMLPLLAALSLWSQGDMPEDEKVRQLRIAFLTQELDLTVEEGQQFWPLFNEFEHAKDGINGQIQNVRMEVKKNKKASTGKVEEGIRQMADLRRQLVDLEEQFMLDALQILGPEKTVKLAKAERKFKQKLLEHVRQGRPGGGPPRRD